MDKITKYELLNMFMYLCNDMGKKIYLSENEVKTMKKWYAERRNDLPCDVVLDGATGGWQLDYARCYGGWQIQEIDNDKGGIYCPLGHRRHSAKDLLNMICFARECLRLKKTVGKNSELKYTE